MTRRSDLDYINVVFIITPDDDRRVAFAIDGRKYARSEDVRRDINDALTELQKRHINAEFVESPIEPDGYTSPLPTWQEYKQSLPPVQQVFDSWKSWEQARAALGQRLSQKTLGRLDDAIAFATRCHSDQLRPTGEAYIIHLLEVLEILTTGLRTTDPDFLAAGLLHDVVEDTPCGLDAIREQFGSQVADWVDSLTQHKGKRDEYFEHFQSASLNVLAIKLADRLSNVQKLDQHPRKEKQKSYYKETVEKIIPLSHRIPWFEMQFELWRKRFEYLAG